MRELVRITVGAVWLALAASKLLAADESIRAAELTFDVSWRMAAVAVYLLTAAEAVMGIGVLSPIRWIHRRCLLGTICFASALTLATLLMPVRTSCGCFGVLGRATAGRRLVVTCGLIFLAVDVLRRVKIQEVQRG